MVSRKVAKIFCCKDVLFVTSFWDISCLLIRCFFYIYVITAPKFQISHNVNWLLIPNLSPLQSKALFTFEFILLSNIEIPFQGLVISSNIYFRDTSNVYECVYFQIKRKICWLSKPLPWLFPENQVISKSQLLALAGALYLPLCHYWSGPVQSGPSI